MNSFKDFNITTETKGFTGNKIKISKILNLEITVIDYKIGPSKFSGQRLDLQVEIDGTKHITWTGSCYMIEMIQKVPRETGFPFKTKIIEDCDRYIFS